MALSDKLKNDEEAIFKLRTLFEKHGYSQYKMSKFEEYDLYVRNKDFLVSDNIITFTDTNGKLMALKPDVTLSIIKNSQYKENYTEKVYYTENVYRISKGTKSFKEIMQSGLECIGDIDDFSIYEVLMLACESLGNISKDYLLDISHMGIISSLIDDSVSGEKKSDILKCICEKNKSGIKSICDEEGIDSSLLCELVGTYGSLADLKPFFEKIKNEKNKDAIDSLSEVVSLLEKNGYNVSIDFSVINDMNYYNGFVFKGFIKGLFTGILSGGEYASLIKKMGKNGGAIGFAVYLDMLEQLNTESKQFDVDTVILYDESCSISAINDAIKLLSANGATVMAERTVPEKVKYKQLLKLQERGVEIIENNA